MSFKKGILKNYVKFSGKQLCWSVFFSYQKQTPTQVCEYREIFENSFFIEHLRWLLPKGFMMDFLTGKFPDSEKFYQQLELDYLNQRR